MKAFFSVAKMPCGSWMRNFCFIGLLLVGYGIARLRGDIDLPVGQRVVDVEQDRADRSGAHSAARSERRRAREWSLPRISMDSNSGGDTRRPVCS